MAQAHRAHGIHPKESLHDNAQRLVSLRLEEFLSWRAALDDPALVTELHDMRIAAKRLRYALEIFDVCFPGVKGPLKDLTQVQEDLGTIHDLDVLVEILRARLHAQQCTLEEEALEIARAATEARERSNRLRALLYGSARDRRILGLLGLITDKVVERERCYAEFQRQWKDGALDELARRIREVTGLQAPADEAPHVDVPAPAPLELPTTISG